MVLDQSARKSGSVKPPCETCDLQIATLWGAKGVTADHVYIIALCEEAIPGTRREEYPGSNLEFKEEQ
jgi:hypothetical protein